MLASVLAIELTANCSEDELPDVWALFLLPPISFPSLSLHSSIAFAVALLS